MKYVVIRDDDTCFFTQPEMLECLYRPLLDAGKPVALSVIPAIGGGQAAGRLNGPFWEQFQLDYSPCLPPDHRELKEIWQLQPDCEIVRYLRQNQEYEIVQHGYNHLIVEGVREGMLTNSPMVEEKIRKSGEIMKSCFGRPSDFFVVPWDDVSRQSLTLLKGCFNGISLHRIGQRHVSWARKPGAILRRFQDDHRRCSYFWDGDFLLLEYPGPILSMFQDPNGMKQKVVDWLDNHDFLILVSHYWEFFWDWSSPNQTLLDAWRDIVDYLLERPDIDIITFGQLHEHLRG